jgi:hypothetical protein
MLFHNCGKMRTIESGMTMSPEKILLRKEDEKIADN